MQYAAWSEKNSLEINDFVYPIFVVPGTNVKEEIPSMPGQYHLSVDNAVKMAEEVYKLGIPAVEVFGLPEYKDEIGSSAWDMTSPVQRAIKAIKSAVPDLVIVGDVCLCQYTLSGHCGVLKGHEVDNDPTLELIAKVALSQAEAGADIVAPSDMMDGRILALRHELDKHGYTNTPIMSYAVKYASAFYGPFRDAAGSAPAFGDRKTYQMDYHNRKEALKKAEQDIAQGADIIMVKPAMSYLDIVRETANQFHVPVAAYSVSGEYAMIEAAANAGLVDREAMICETAVGIYRAGANILISYHAKELAKFMDEGRIG